MKKKKKGFFFCFFLVQKEREMNKNEIYKLFVLFCFAISDNVFNFIYVIVWFITLDVYQRFVHKTYE